MANYPTHLNAGLATGLVGSFMCFHFGYIDIYALPITTFVCTFGGIAPDMDHDSGRPIRIVFTWIAIVYPTLVVWKLSPFVTPLYYLLIGWVSMAVLLRYPVAFIFKKATKHRGIFHSVPAIFIFGAGMYLLADLPDKQLQLCIGIMSALGYFIHLLLDEIWSVDFNGLDLRSKASQGTALALVKKNIILTVVAYLLAYWMCKKAYIDYTTIHPEGIPWFI